MVFSRSLIKSHEKPPILESGREMAPSPAITILGETVWDLPPLILHPFNERVAPSTLLESSKAALMLSGLIPHEGADPDDLKRRLLSGRYEIGRAHV